MPHDMNGYEIKVGDKVALYAIVKEVQTGETACNAQVEVEAPEGEYQPVITLNSRSLNVSEF